MSKKITNAQNVENYINRKKLLIGWFVTSVITIVLAIVSLILNYGLKKDLAGNICMLMALCCFFVSIIIRKMREKIVVETKKEEKEPEKKKKTTKKSTTKNKTTKKTNK